MYIFPYILQLQMAQLEYFSIGAYFKPTSVELTQDLIEGRSSNWAITEPRWEWGLLLSETHLKVEPSERSCWRSRAWRWRRWGRSSLKPGERTPTPPRPPRGRTRTRLETNQQYYFIHTGKWNACNQAQYTVSQLSGQHSFRTFNRALRAVDAGITGPRC